MALLAATALLIMLMTSERMSSLFVALPRLRHAVEWLAQWPLPLDIHHVVFFALLAMAMRMLVPRVPWGWLLLGLAALAATTELLQFGAVGRSPHLSDLRDDVIGAWGGLLLGGHAMWCARRLRCRRPKAPADLGDASCDGRAEVASGAIDCSQRALPQAARSSSSMTAGSAS